MRKSVTSAFLALVSLAFALESYAQSRVYVPITNFRYRNSHHATAVTSAGVVKGDSLSGTTNDTLLIPIVQGGGLAPLGVQITITASDADVSGTPDTVAVRYQAGVGGTYYQIGGAVGRRAELAAMGSYTRTFIFNTTGAAVAFNTQAVVSPYFETLRMLLQTDTSGDSVKYVVKAAGIYQRQ